MTSSSLPPDDVRDILNLSPELMLRLRKSAHCLVNTAKQLSDRFKFRGVTCVHADDLLGGSDEVSDRTILASKREFDSDAWEALVGRM